MEDDITASVVVPAAPARPRPRARAPSVKLVENCEYRLFQRPDDAIHRGFDRQTEADIATPGNFLSNFEPLTRRGRRRDASTSADRSTSSPRRWRTCSATFADAPEGDGPATSSARPTRGWSTASRRRTRATCSSGPTAPTPRDRTSPSWARGCAGGCRPGAPLPLPVDAVLAGRRNNPPEPARSAAGVYGPIHYQELPELFMDFICSLTGKSPSTTGAGSEGALTKGPFNALPAIVDLNAALVSYVLTGLRRLAVGGRLRRPGRARRPRHQPAHPRVWCRLTAEERDPAS